MAGKVAVITGCNTGIGKETAKELHGKGFEVVFACRSKEKAEQAIADIASANKADDGSKRLVFLESFDASSLTSVKDFCEKFIKAYSRLDVLILNAGTGYLKREDRITKDGFEGVFQINYFSHFVMTVFLTPLLKKTEGSRMVSLTSVEHRFTDSKCDWETITKKTTTAASYPASKLALLYLAYELQRRTGIQTAAANPGFVGSDIWRYLRGWKRNLQGLLNKTVALTTKQGCQTSVWASTSTDLPKGPVYVSPYRVYDCCPKAWDSVNFYNGPTVCQSSKISYNTTEAARLWDFSIAALKAFLPTDLPEGFAA
jgi:NAD(P)-dependent dehydrogenase (short-subunit alcohol dehydrogenase family)